MMRKYLPLLLILVMCSCNGNEGNKTIVAAEDESTPAVAPEQEETSGPEVKGEEEEEQAVSETKEPARYGLKLEKIIDVQVVDPDAKDIINFLGDENIAVHCHPYHQLSPADELNYIYNIQEDEIKDYILLENIMDVSFWSAYEDKMIYAAKKKKDVYSFVLYDLNNKEKKVISRKEFFEYKKKRQFENFRALQDSKAHGEEEYKWSGLSLNLWRALRPDQGLTLSADEYSLGLFQENELLFTFPYVRVAGSGLFSTSPDGKYLAIETGFYRKDIFRDNPPPYKPNPPIGHRPNFSGTEGDMYQYCVFLYQLVTEENVQILDDPMVEMLTFPSPSEVEDGIREVRRHRFDGSHLYVYPGEKPLWGTAIQLHKDTPVYYEPEVSSGEVEEYKASEKHEIIVSRGEKEEEVNGTSGYWYYIEDSYGQRGWVFGEDAFEVVKEKPYHFDEEEY
jgi:hypothetical protein